MRCFKKKNGSRLIVLPFKVMLVCGDALLLSASALSPIWIDVDLRTCLPLLLRLLLGDTSLSSALSLCLLHLGMLLRCRGTGLLLLGLLM